MHSLLHIQYFCRHHHISLSAWTILEPAMERGYYRVHWHSLLWFKGGSLASSHPIPISLKAMWQRIEYWQPSTSHPRSGSRCGTRTYGSVLGVEENIVWKKFGRVKAEKISDPEIAVQIEFAHVTRITGLRAGGKCTYVLSDIHTISQNL